VTDGPNRPVQVHGEVLSTRRVGAYYHISLVAPGIADTTRPGQFVALAVGGPDTALVLRRAFSIYKVSSRGVYGGTVEIVFAVSGAGTAWLARQPQHAPVDVVGPLGKPFALPRERVSATLVGGGYGSAPLFALAEALHTRGCRVDFVLGAGSEDRLFGALDAKRMASTVAITTDDGSSGLRGRVTDALPEVMARAGTEVIYACGPMAMLAAVTEVAS
jgi:dihydroorotate dehydrogenase electron transfer subunit